MGWAMIVAERGKNYFHVFVNERFRNRGVAAGLIGAAVQRGMKIVLSAHDEATWHLFSKMKKQYPRNVTVFDWDKHREKAAREIILRFGDKFSFYELMLLFKRPRS